MCHSDLSQNGYRTGAILSELVVFSSGDMLHGRCILCSAFSHCVLLKASRGCNSKQALHAILVLFSIAYAGGCRSLCGALRPNGYGMQECQLSRFRKNASEVTAERMEAKSIQTECKRSLSGKNANGIASERMQTKPLQREGQRSRFRKNANEVAASPCNETDIQPQATHPRARVQTKSLQKECTRTHAHEVASERKLSKSHQKECQPNRFRKNASESIQT